MDAFERLDVQDKKGGRIKRAPKFLLHRLRWGGMGK